MVAVLRCLFAAMLVALLSGLFGAVPALAQGPCSGLTYILVDTYAAGDSYSIPVPGDTVCMRFVGASEYQVDELGLGLSPHTGTVELQVNPGLPVALITGASSVEVWQGLTPSYTPTSTVSPTPSLTPSATAVPSGCVTVSSVVIGSHHQIVFPDTGTTLHGGDIYGWSVRSLDQAFDLNVFSGAGGSGSVVVHAIDSTVFEVINLHGGSFSMNSYIPFGGQAFTVEYCTFSVATATPTVTPSPTVTASPTRTPLPSPLPSQGVCTAYSALGSGEAFYRRLNGNFQGYTMRILTGLDTGPVQVEALLISGASQFATVDQYSFLAVNVSTVYLEWTADHAFTFQLCTGVTVSPTRTAAPVLGTATATRTPTPTSTTTPTGSPVATLTLVPTPTLVPTCLTPVSEDAAECTIIDLLQTQIAAQVGPTVATPIVAATPVPNFQTAVAIVCEVDPCASLSVVSEGVHQVVQKLQQHQNAPDCASVTIPGFGGSGPWALPSEGVGVGFCAFIDWTENIRGYLRALSLFFIGFIAVRYAMRTSRRLGDV